MGHGFCGTNALARLPFWFHGAKSVSTKTFLKLAIDGSAPPEPPHNEIVKGRRGIFGRANWDI
jgi:hypothetical protein